MHKGFLWVLIEKFGAAFLSIVAFFIYAKYLSTEEMGIAIVILSITQFLSLLLNSFFEDALVQKEKLTESDVNSSFWISSIISLMLIILTCCGFYLWGQKIPQYAILSMAAFASLEILFTNMTTTYVAQLRRDGHFKILAFRVIIGRIGGALVGLGCIFSNLGPWSLIAQSVVGITLQLLILLFSVGKFPRFEIHLSLFKETAKFGSMMTLRRLSWDALVRMTPIAANIVGGPSMAGIVGFSWRIVELIRGSISSGLGAYLLPLIARDKNNKPKMANDFLNITGITVFFVAPIFLGLYLITPNIISVFFNDKWNDAIPLIQIFSIAALIGLYRTPAVITVNAAGYPGKMLIPDSLASIMSISLMLIFGSNGAWVIAISYLAFILVLLPTSFKVVKDILNISTFDQIKPIFHYALPANIMFITLFILHPFLDKLYFNSLIIMFLYMMLGGVIFLISSLLLYKNDLIAWKDSFKTQKSVN